MENYIAPFRMVGNLYFVGTYAASSHLIDTGAGLILIDTGYEQNADIIVENMKTLGFDIADVKLILHSHGHYDHTDATQHLLPLCHARTYLGREDLRYIHGFEPDEYYVDGGKITLGNTEILCLHTPGHTNGTYSFFWNILHEGEVLRAGMFGGAGVNQLKKGYLDARGLYYFQRADYFCSVERLLDEQVDVFVGNHSWNNKTMEKAQVLSETGENLFIDREIWGRFLKRCARKLRDILATESRETFVNYAHRGASEYCPENTLMSFYSGVKMGANGIETDVRATRDGELVLFHDDTLERVTGEIGSVGDFTWEELQSFLVKKNDLCDKIVRLEDFLSHFAFRDLTFAVELKEKGHAEQIAALLRKYDMQKKTVVTSFRLSWLEEFKKAAPEFKLGYLTKDPSEEILSRMRAIGIDELCPKAELIESAEQVAAWHAAGFRVRAWGVKNEDLMKRAYDAGVDGMTVNFPDKLSAYIEKERAEMASEVEKNDSSEKKDFSLILASQSPRRREILENLGVKFEVWVADTDESSNESDPCRLVEELSLRKAEAVREALIREGRMTDGTVILASDTVVSVDGRILGKPHGEREAIEMLSMLAGRRHRVISGLALIGAGKSGTAHEITEVEFDDMDAETILHYVRTAEPYDKAGAYAIQGLASAWIRGIHGCYFNVVGLPVHRLNRLFGELFGKNLF